MLFFQENQSLDSVIKDTIELAKMCEDLKKNYYYLQTEESSLCEALIAELRKQGLDSYTDIISPHITTSRTWGREEDTYEYFLFKLTNPFSTGWGSVRFSEQVLRQSSLTGDYLFEMNLIPAKVPDFLEYHVHEGNCMTVLRRHTKELKDGMQKELKPYLFMYESKAKVHNVSIEDEFLHVNIELIQNNTVRYPNAVEHVLSYLIQKQMYFEFVKLTYNL